jgi:DNA modification methylase
LTQLLTNRHHILVGDVMTQLKGLAPKSVHCIVTSPPYFGLRNYGTEQWEGGDPLCNHLPLRANGDDSSGLEGSKASQSHRQEGFKGNTCPKCGATKVDRQLGLEKTPELYIKRLVKIMRAARRVLRDDGSLWLNLGDSYWGSWGNSGNRPQLDGETRGQRERESEYLPRGGYDNHRERPATSFKVPGLKNKDLIGIPWMAAFALRQDGWWLRSDVIWSKPNTMPESVEDRPAKSHEYVFLLTKNSDYYYDVEGVREQTRNRRTVWTISTTASQVSHFAVFPPQLPLVAIMASTSGHGVCPECGAPWNRIKDEEGRTAGWAAACVCKKSIETVPATVLDLFHGSGTTGAVAEYLERRYIGIELNPEYVELYDARCAEVRRSIIGGDSPVKDVADDSQINLFQEET